MNTRIDKYMALLIATLLALATSPTAFAQGVTVRVADVTKIKGQRTNTLIGMGLVTGLDGTGDGDDYLPTMRALMSAIGHLANPVTTIDELGGTENVAIVMIEATIPEFGAREGDRIDVKVTAILPGATDTPIWDDRPGFDRSKMMQPADVAGFLVSIVARPNIAVEEVTIRPPAGVL